MNIKKKKVRDPYKIARKEWDNVINRTWRANRFMALLSVISMIACLGALQFTFSHIKKPALVPYVVTVDKTDGSVDFRGVINSASITITDASVINTLQRFVGNLRMVSSDLVVVKMNLKDSYYIASLSAQRLLTEQISKLEDNPLKLSGDGIRRGIRWQVFEKISEKTWRAEWLEEVYQDGILKETNQKTGTFSYITQNPGTQIEAEKNPLGIYITDFFITDKRYK